VGSWFPSVGSAHRNKPKQQTSGISATAQKPKLFEILFIVLSGHEIWSVGRREQHTAVAYETMLRRVQVRQGNLIFLSWHCVRNPQVSLPDVASV
jgi:hypothetical protein